MTNQEKRNKGAKTVEFEDAPSGMITLYNYKEPFMDFVDEATGGGFGYQGVLISEENTWEGVLVGTTIIINL